jgi:hypothetical protein
VVDSLQVCSTEVIISRPGNLEMLFTYILLGVRKASPTVVMRRPERLAKPLPIVFLSGSC